MTDGLRAPAELHGLESPARAAGALEQDGGAVPVLLGQTAAPDGTRAAAAPTPGAEARQPPAPSPPLHLGAHYLAPYTDFHRPALDLTSALRDTYDVSTSQHQAAAQDQQQRIQARLQKHPRSSPHGVPVVSLCALPSAEAREAALSAALARRCRRSGAAFTPPADLTDDAGCDATGAMAGADGDGAAGSKGSLVFPTTPAGPPAAAILELPLYPAAEPYAAGDGGSNRPAAAATAAADPSRPHFLPAWLAPSLGPSLTHLDLSHSALIDNRGWGWGWGRAASSAAPAAGASGARNGLGGGGGGGAGRASGPGAGAGGDDAFFDVLAALPRLAVLSLHGSALAAPLPGDLPARLPGLRALDLAGARFRVPVSRVKAMLRELAEAAAEGAAAAAGEGGWPAGAAADAGLEGSVAAEAAAVAAGGGGGGGGCGGRRRTVPLLLGTSCGHQGDVMDVWGWSEPAPQRSEEEGKQRKAEAEGGAEGEQQEGQEEQQKEREPAEEAVSSAAALCAVRASLERAFLHYATHGAAGAAAAAAAASNASSGLAAGPITAGAWFELRHPSRLDYGYNSEDEDEADEEEMERGGGGGRGNNGGGDDDDGGDEAAAWAAHERAAARKRRAKQRAMERLAAGGDGRVPCLGVEGLALDPSMLLLVVELGLLPPAAADVGEEDEGHEEEEEGHGEHGEQGGQEDEDEDAARQQGGGGEPEAALRRRRDAAGGARGKELGRQHLVMGRTPRRRLVLEDVVLALRWPYRSRRLDEPAWSHDQHLHTPHRDRLGAPLTARQWRHLTWQLRRRQQAVTAAAAAGAGAGAAPGAPAAASSGGGGAAAAAAGAGAGASAGAGAGGDPFACELLPFQELEERERLTACALETCMTGDARPFCAGDRAPRGSAARPSVNAEHAWRLAEARPPPATPVAAPTAAALAARTAARRALVAALLGLPEAALEAAAAAQTAEAAAATTAAGGGEDKGATRKGKGTVAATAAAAAVQPPPVQVSLSTFLTAVRLEARLFARVRRVSILPRGHASHDAFTRGRYWGSVRALAEALRTDARVRTCVLTGKLSLAAATELRPEELSPAARKLVKAGAAAAAGGSGGGGGGGSSAAVALAASLAARAAEAADQSDLEVLQKQVSVGGDVLRRLPLHPEDWLPADAPRAADSLAAGWFVAHPGVWPHGTVLHGLAARGCVRAAAWVLDRAPALLRVAASGWQLTPLHLCCMRPCQWRSTSHFLSLISLPRPPPPPPLPAAAASTTTATSTPAASITGVTSNGNGSSNGGNHRQAHDSNSNGGDLVLDQDVDGDEDEDEAHDARLRAAVPRAHPDAPRGSSPQLRQQYYQRRGLQASYEEYDDPDRAYDILGDEARYRYGGGARAEAEARLDQLLLLSRRCGASGGGVDGGGGGDGGRSPYLTPHELLFPRVSGLRVRHISVERALGPLWYAADDEAPPLAATAARATGRSGGVGTGAMAERQQQQQDKASRLQQPLARALPGTAPAAGPSGAGGEDVGGGAAKGGGGAGGARSADGALGGGAGAAAALAAEASPMLRLLLSRGADTEAVGWSGLTPAQCAAATCGVAALAALAAAGADVRRPYPGSLVGPLHLLAYRAGCRWAGGVTPRAAARLFSASAAAAAAAAATPPGAGTDPGGGAAAPSSGGLEAAALTSLAPAATAARAATGGGAGGGGGGGGGGWIPPSALLCEQDEWRCCALFWMVRAPEAERHRSGVLPAPALGVLLAALRQGLTAAGARPPPPAAVEGVARVLAALVGSLSVEHARLLLAAWPEAAGVGLPPLRLTALHLACLLPAWGADTTEGSLLRGAVTAGPVPGPLMSRVPQVVLQEVQPYAYVAPPAAGGPGSCHSFAPGPDADAATATPPPAPKPAPGAHERRGGRWRNRLPRRSASSDDDNGHDGDGGSDDDSDGSRHEVTGAAAPQLPAPECWGFWPYPLAAELWPEDEEAGEGSDAAMQRCMGAQLQLVHLLLAGCAPVEAADVNGATPLMCAALAATPPVVAALLAKGASPTAQASVFRLPVHDEKGVHKRGLHGSASGLDYLLMVPPPGSSSSSSSSSSGGGSGNSRGSNARGEGGGGGGGGSSTGMDAAAAAAAAGAASQAAVAAAAPDDNPAVAAAAEWEDVSEEARAWRDVEGRRRHYKKLAQRHFVLTPLTAAVLRFMQLLLLDARPPGRADSPADARGRPARSSLHATDTAKRQNRFNRAGDGILWLLMCHGPPALRAAVLPPLRATDISKLAELAPRTALAVAEDALPGNAYLSFAVRAAREACATLSPFTLSSLDSAVSKAVTLALDTDPRRRVNAHKGASNAQQHTKTGGAGKTETAATAARRQFWGPYEDEVLYDLMRCGLYPLFASSEFTNGESALLRMAAQLLQFANRMRHGRRALLAAHVAQFPPRRLPAPAADTVAAAPPPLGLPAPPSGAAVMPAAAGAAVAVAVGSSGGGGGGEGGGGDGVGVYVEAALTGTLSLAHTEALLLQGFDAACGLSQARAGGGFGSAGGGGGGGGVPASAAAAAAGAAAGPPLEGGRGRSVTAAAGGGGGGGGGGGDSDGVLVLHTQDDLEYGMTYARVAEVMPPVCSMRFAVGHRAPLPDLTVRKLAGTIFKMVRQLCHISQTELAWVRLPGGVTVTHADGLFMPLAPGHPDWSPTDLFRPNKFGFRLSLAYTRRTMMVELHALALNRSVPIAVAERLKAAVAAVATAAAAGAGGDSGGSRGAGAPGGGGGGGGGGTEGRRRVGAAALDPGYGRLDEFQCWIRNPDVVRMEQVQHMAGRMEEASKAVGGNWRQMPVPPSWWISGWVDRFLRLYVLAAVGKGKELERAGLHSLYDPAIPAPWLPDPPRKGRSKGRSRGRRRRAKGAKGDVAAGGAGAGAGAGAARAGGAAAAEEHQETTGPGVLLPPPGVGANTAPWRRDEVNVFGTVLAIIQSPLTSVLAGGLSDSDNDDVDSRAPVLPDATGRPTSARDWNRVMKMMDKYGSKATGRDEKEHPDRGCVVFTAVWNKMAQRAGWPARSTLEVMAMVSRLTRLACCSYDTQWEASLQVMMGMLGSGGVSPELRREVEGKLISLASDGAFLRRLVWGMCRGRRSEARCVALLSGVVEFQPGLLAALAEHEAAQAGARGAWERDEAACWAVAAGPALAGMAPEQLAALLAAQHGLAAPPYVVPYSAAATGLPSLAAELKKAAAAAEAAAAAAHAGHAAGAEGAQTPANGGAAAAGAAPLGAAGGGGGDAGGGARRHMMYIRFDTRAALERAVAAPLVVRAEEEKRKHASRPATSRAGAAARGSSASTTTTSVVAVLPVAAWEAGAVPPSRLPGREEEEAGGGGGGVRVLSFFDLVFRRLPSGLSGRDPHAGGTLWGAGLPAVLLLRRPAHTRWSPWRGGADVAEEAGVVGPVFDAHATAPLPRNWMQELDANDNGLVTYREFLLAYLRHRAGDFFGGGIRGAAVASTLGGGSVGASAGAGAGAGAPATAAAGAGPGPPPLVPLPGGGSLAAATAATATPTTTSGLAGGSGGAAVTNATSAASVAGGGVGVDGGSPGPTGGAVSPPAGAAAAAAAAGAGAAAAAGAGVSPWQRAADAVQGQLSQAFWDRGQALRRLRENQAQLQKDARQRALLAAERRHSVTRSRGAASITGGGGGRSMRQPSQPAARGGLAAVRQLGAKALGALGAGGVGVADAYGARGGGGGGGFWLPGVCLAGLDCVAREEVCEVQRCAWVAYANLRSAARYLIASNAAEAATVGSATATASTAATAVAGGAVGAWQAAERAALQSVLRGLQRPEDLFGCTSSSSSSSGGGSGSSSNNGGGSGGDAGAAADVKAQQATTGDGHAATVGGAAAPGPAAGAAGAGAGARPWLQLLAGVPTPVAAAAAAGLQQAAAATASPAAAGDAVGALGTGGPAAAVAAAASAVADKVAPSGSSSPRDAALLELLLDLASATAGRDSGTAASATADAAAGAPGYVGCSPAWAARGVHGDLVDEGEYEAVGPLAGGVCRLLRGRTLAAAAMQVGMDAAAQLASAAGSAALATAAAAALRDGLPPPRGGCDAVFAASALKLAAEEVWGFVVDMQALVDGVISPLVAAADQSLPIIGRESITAIFGDTNIELILEYEVELLKLLTRGWAASAATALVVPSAAGPAHYLLGSVQRRMAAARLRAWRGDFPPCAEQLGIDPLSTGVQLRPLLAAPPEDAATDPVGAGPAAAAALAGEVLELLGRLATAYSRYLDNLDSALQELLECLERADEKGTFTALLRRFGRPVKAKARRSQRQPPASASADATSDGKAGGGRSAVDDGSSSNSSSSSDSSGSSRGEGAAAAGGDGGGNKAGQPPAAGESPQQRRRRQVLSRKAAAAAKARAKFADVEAKRLEHPRHHHVRPLLSVRQMARFGPGAEVEACLRKPAAHLPALAFLATLCRSLTAAAEGANDESSSGGGGPEGGAPVAPHAASAAHAKPADPDGGVTDGAVAGKSATLSAKAANGTAGSSSSTTTTTTGGTSGAGAGSGGLLSVLRGVWQRLASGGRLARVLPLGVGAVHPLLQVGLTSSAPGGAPRAASAEHRVLLRAIGAGLAAAERAAGGASGGGGGGGGGTGGGLGGLSGGGAMLADRLNAWMERNLLSGGAASRALLVTCTALACLTWRVVPLLAERRRYLAELRTAHNLLRHRRVVLALERAINVRPDDDDELEAELAQLHAAIGRGVREAAAEIALGDADPDKVSPMNLNARFWATRAPRRVRDLAPLRAALAAAEAATLHSTFAGARLLSNARRCAARMEAAAAQSAADARGGAAGGGAAGTGRAAGDAAGGAGGGAGGAGDESDEAEAFLDALAGGPAAAAAAAKDRERTRAKRKGAVAPGTIAPAPAAKPGTAAEAAAAAGDGRQGDVAGKAAAQVVGGAAGGKAAAAGGEAAAPADGAGAGAVAAGNTARSIGLARLFGSKATQAWGAAGGAEGAASGGGGGLGGMAAAARAAQLAKRFGTSLRRAVRRREHARRRWDKTLYLVMQSGALDEALLERQQREAFAALRRGAALAAWRQLRGVWDDLLMVFGAVAFRDVGRAFAPLMAAFLMLYPFVVLAVALAISPTTPQGRGVMGALVGGYCLVGFGAMAAAVAQLRRDPSQLKVYRPSDTIRFPNFRRGTALASWKAHWVNVFALFTLVLEFWQLCAFSYQRRVPYPRASLLKRLFPWALLDLGPAAYFLQVAALIAFMVAWIAVFFPQTPAGAKRLIMPFLGQAAYLTITSGLLSQLDCRLADGALVRNPQLTCWTQPQHLAGAVAALAALGLYVPRATLTPFEWPTPALGAQVFFPSDNLDIKYRGLYVRVVQLLRLGMAGYNLFFANSYPLTVMAANCGVCCLLLGLTVVMRPCCIAAVNICRGTGFAAAAWSQAVSVAALRLSRDVYLDPATRQWYTQSWAYVYVLGAGWAALLLGGALLLRRHLRQLRGASSIAFSLRRSPFNYTAPLALLTTTPAAAGPTEAAPGAAAAAAGGRARSGGAKAPVTAGRQASQLAQPPPPAVASAAGTAAAAAAAAATAAAAAATAAAGSSSTITARGAAAVEGSDDDDRSGGKGAAPAARRRRRNGGSGSASSSGSEGRGSSDEQEDSDLADSDNDGSDRDSSSAGSGSGSGSGSGRGASAAVIAAATSGAALGLPVMSPALLRQLAAQGLLTPADEMRGYVSRMVMKAERQFEGCGAAGDSSCESGSGSGGDDSDDSDDGDGEGNGEDGEGRSVCSSQREQQGNAGAHRSGDDNGSSDGGSSGGRSPRRSQGSARADVGVGSGGGSRSSRCSSAAGRPCGSSAAGGSRRGEPQQAQSAESGISDDEVDGRQGKGQGKGQEHGPTDVQADATERLARESSNSGALLLPGDGPRGEAQAEQDAAGVGVPAETAEATAAAGAPAGAAAAGPEE
ncbi:hypothetical protein HYH02_000503 [Chlamydomonas schloesseri]|uniref:Uncharacterized protein n=1 Tax=Chlamydomonas schloesseri TaxID=2026947 RepID=A0A835WUR3_9CHLO|nr:hypothetical protein HYH02_000503 [Chlamydomonas schloesseri]|eukprot:KAG2454664.1 hypothetical protein HYH02_000503 [Chlamydomonas schloesseri]